MELKDRELTLERILQATSVLKRFEGEPVAGLLFPEDTFYSLMNKIKDFLPSLKHAGLYAVPLTEQMQSDLGISIPVRSYRATPLGKGIMQKILNKELKTTLNDAEEAYLKKRGAQRSPPPEDFQPRY